MRIGDVLYHGDRRYILSDVQHQTFDNGERLVLVYIAEHVPEPLSWWRRVLRGMVNLN